MEEDKGFRDFMFNPVVGNEKKRALIQRIQKEAGLQTYTANFLNLILDRQRIEALENIFEAFEVAYCKRTDTQVSASLDVCSKLVAAAAHCQSCLAREEVKPEEYYQALLCLSNSSTPALLSVHSELPSNSQYIVLPCLLAA